MVQEPTSYIYLGVDDLLKNGRSQDSIYILEPSNTRLFLINTSAISTSSLRFGQKISTFCASPLRLADVKYQFSRYGTPKARAFATFIII